MKLFLVVLTLFGILSSHGTTLETNLLPSVFIRLDDIQGLFGGQTLVVQTDGHLYARKVRGREESRFQLKLTPEEVGGIQSLILTCGIADYSENKRPGVPDEARPRIIVTQHGSKRIDVEKWANAKDRRFDVLYQHLLQWVEKAARTRAYRKKEYDYRSAFP